MARSARAASAAVLLFAVAFAGGGAAAQAPARPSEDPCAVARRAEADADALRLTEALRAEITRYRAAWISFCARAGGSLHGLLALADALAENFKPILEAPRAQEEETIARVDAAFRRQLPSFVPGFEGAYRPAAYFRPRLILFAAHAARGDADDRRFFADVPALFGADPALAAWQRRVAPAGSCTRFGEYDWRGAFARLDKLRAAAKAPSYAARLDAWEARFKHEMWALGRGTGRICACAVQKATVNRDLALIATVIEKREGYEDTLAEVRARIDGLNAQGMMVLGPDHPRCRQQ
jgi:hypothetical protein